MSRGVPLTSVMSRDEISEVIARSPTFKHATVALGVSKRTTLAYAHELGVWPYQSRRGRGGAMSALLAEIPEVLAARGRCTAAELVTAVQYECGPVTERTVYRYLARCVEAGTVKQFGAKHTVGTTYEAAHKRGRRS